MVLADQGADVIKVESPRYGDESRQLVNYRDGMAALTLNTNQGKRSIGINLKDPAGLEVLLELVKTADVFVQNWRPGAAARLKVDEASLRAVKPDIIYASISGYGEDGPYAERRGYDPIFQSLTGYVAAQTNPEIPFPDVVRNTPIDMATSLYLAQAITAALLARERGADGQHLRLAMIDSGLSFFWPTGMMRQTFVGDQPENFVVPGERYQVTDTADGKLVMWMSTSDQQRAALVAVGRADLANDPSQNGLAMLEPASVEARAVAMRDGCAAMSTKDLYARLVELEVPVAPVNTPADVIVDPQVIHNNSVVEDEHPVYGRVRRVRPPVRFSGTQADTTAPAPLYGEQSMEILTELGFDETQCRALVEAGTIAVVQDPK